MVLRIGAASLPGVGVYSGFVFVSTVSGIVTRPVGGGFVDFRKFIVPKIQPSSVTWKYMCETSTSRLIRVRSVQRLKESLQNKYGSY